MYDKTLGCDSWSVTPTNRFLLSRYLAALAHPYCRGGPASEQISINRRLVPGVAERAPPINCECFYVSIVLIKLPLCVVRHGMEGTDCA